MNPELQTLPPPQMLTAHSSTKGVIKKLFHQLQEAIPLDGILVGFLDNATFTTYWLNHYSLVGAPEVPCAFVHTGNEMQGLMSRSTWDREGNWIRIVNDPGSTMLGKFFANHMKSDDFSIMHVRSSFDASKRGHFLLYARGQGRYTQAHTEIVAEQEQLIILLTSAAIKDFLLQQLQAACAPPANKVRMETEVYDLVATSPSMLEIVRKLELISQLPTPLLLTGETGVGKEMFADFIHFHSPRREMPFIKVNCGAIPPTLLDSELFGHEKGAFTGAVMQKAGCFELAHNGTLLLDEMGEMPLDVQVRLLRVLQTGIFMRIGGNKTIVTDTRVIASTNRNVIEMLNKGAFREDLFYRLNVYHIHIPPLRERLEDLPLLVRIMMRKLVKKLNIKMPPIVQQSNMDALAQFPWKGNVRELQNAIEASLINHMLSPVPDGFWITPDTKHYESGPGQARETPPPSLPGKRPELTLSFEESVRQILVDALHLCAGKVHGQNGAAALLGLNASTLWGKLNKYGIRPQSFKL